MLFLQSAQESASKLTKERREPPRYTLIAGGNDLYGFPHRDKIAPKNWQRTMTVTGVMGSDNQVHLYLVRDAAINGTLVEIEDFSASLKSGIKFKLKGAKEYFTASICYAIFTEGKGRQWLG